MEKNSRIYIAGHRGMVGSAILRTLQQSSFKNLITKTRNELDLLDAKAVESFFLQERPEFVFLAAAKVGGIHANSTYPADFIHQNLSIELNVIHSAYQAGVTKLLFLGSSCIYPKMAAQPIKEEYLLTGPLEPTNEAYAIAKISGIRMCQSYNRQYGTRFISAMPTNLFGKNDNYHPENSHVVAALIRKYHEAKINQEKELTIWGTGTPKREFLFVEDLADACLFLMDHYEESEHINVGTGIETTINELAGLIGEVVGYRPELRFDTQKPDGTPRKVMDVSRINQLGWKAKTPLKEGLKKAYEHYLQTL